MRLAKSAEEISAKLEDEGPAPASALARFDLQELLSVLWRQKNVIVATVFVVMALSYVVLKSLTPLYTASALIEINPRQTQVVDFEAVLSGLPADVETIQTEIEIIKSRKLAQRAITRLELSRDPEFNPFLRAPGLITSWRRSLGAWMASFVVPADDPLNGPVESPVDPATGDPAPLEESPDLAGQDPAAQDLAAQDSAPDALTKEAMVQEGLLQQGLVQDGLAENGTGLADPAEGAEGAEGQEAPAGAPQGFFASLLLDLANLVSPGGAAVLSEEDAIKRERELIVNAFLGKLKVEPHGRSRIVRISFESESPATAAAAVNALADYYIVAQLEAKFEATKRATTWLSERVEQLRGEVQDKERAIEEYRAASGLLQGGRDATLTSEQVSELNAQHVLELARLAEAQARLRQVNKLLTTESAVETSIEVLESPLIRDLRREESRVERVLAELSEEYGERHPTMINARSELRDLRQKIRLEIGRIVQGLRNEVAVAQARASSLAQSLERAKQEVAETNQSEVQLRALEREASASRTLLETLLQRTKQTTSQESFQQADASIVSQASTPNNPSFPKKKIFMALVFLGAVALGVALAFALEQLDLGFRSSEQIARDLGVRSLGLLPSVSKMAALGKSLPDYVLENPNSAFGEAVRSLYTNLLLSDVVERPKIVLMASSLPREGKTTIALSLARLLALVGQRVIVVDCDLRRANVHKGLGMEAGPGLTDCLTEGVRPEDVIQVDEKSGVHVLRAGSPLPYSPEQLDSGVMQRLLRSLGRKYDLVLLDSAPVMAVSDALFIARLADRTIFLVRWARTRRSVVTLALKQLMAAQANLAGVLLTMVDVKSHAQYGYGDSGSYHGTLKKYYSS